MRRLPKMIACAALLPATALAGCGGGSAATTAQSPVAPKSTAIRFRSSGIPAGTIPARYTCAGPNISPPLEWGAVPNGTRELLLYVIGLAPTSNSSSYKVSIEWAVAGVNPDLHRIVAGLLPPGANVGLNSAGKRRYSVCPKKGATENYQFMVYAVPATFPIPSHFSGLSVLAELSQSNSTTSATAQGSFAASYTRS